MRSVCASWTSCRSSGTSVSSRCSTSVIRSAVSICSVSHPSHKGRKEEGVESSRAMPLRASPSRGSVQASHRPKFAPRASRACPPRPGPWARRSSVPVRRAMSGIEACLRRTGSSWRNGGWRATEGEVSRAGRQCELSKRGQNQKRGHRVSSSVCVRERIEKKGFTVDRLREDLHAFVDCSRLDEPWSGQIGNDEVRLHLPVRPIDRRVRSSRSTR